MLRRDGQYYIIAFDDGTYYRGASFSNEQTTEDINRAMLYDFDWQIPKDLYFQMFLEGKGIGYKVVKVNSKRTNEIVS